MLVPRLLFFFPSRSRSSAGAADVCSATSRLSLRENSRKSGRRAMYAKWRGRPWRKPKLSDKFSCDAGRATTSRGGQRRPGVTFEYVDYNCDLCRGLCSSLSLSLSLCHLLPYSLVPTFARAHAIHSFSSLYPLSLYCFFYSLRYCTTGASRTASDDRIRNGVLLWRIVELREVRVVAENFERKIERSLKSVESKQLPYRPAIRHRTIPVKQNNFT